MKKLLFALFMLFTCLSFSQEEENISKKSELSTNLFDLVVAGSFNINYERLFENNQSLFISATFFDTYGYFDAGYLEKSEAFSLKAAYIIYFKKEKDHAGFNFYPLLKLRTGKVFVDDGYYYDNSIDESQYKFSYDIGGFAAGFGLGHKWLFSNKFTLSVHGEIARNLGSFDDEYLEGDNIEPRIGINFGYRF